jgi:hypothetical protein
MAFTGKLKQGGRSHFPPAVYLPVRSSDAPTRQEGQLPRHLHAGSRKDTQMAIIMIYLFL